jgi:radical SAM protein with 4Fe4S-binding SPASM domain
VVAGIAVDAPAPVPAPVVPAPARVVADRGLMSSAVSSTRSLSFLTDKQGVTPDSNIRIHHYRYEDAGGKSRLHLRLDPDGHGTLIVNANRIMHLNPTAALMAHLILEGHDEAQIVKAIKRRYRVSSGQTRQDYHIFKTQLYELVRPDGACPVHDLELDLLAPFSVRPSAPYRMDLALTYRCNNNCAHCYNARPRTFGEQSSDEWKRIIDRIWDLGIPHVVFTGGEPTMYPDLPELIAYAEEKGQITGLNTNARRLSDPDYLEKLVKAGLDHVQITLESSDQQVHDHMVSHQGAFLQTVRGLKNALASQLFVMTNTTMLRDNVHTIPGTLDFLAELGVPTIGLNALIYSGLGATVGTGLSERELYPLLELARKKTEANNQRLIWYTPTEYCHFDPMLLDLGIKGCTAALYNMCIEPDGSVLPCQSYYHSLGNILNDDWHTIWNHDLSIRLRDRLGIPEKCKACGLLVECGGGCPLKLEYIKSMETCA